MCVFFFFLNAPLIKCTTVLTVSLDSTPVSVKFHILSNFLSWIDFISSQELVPLIYMFGLTERKKKCRQGLGTLFVLTLFQLPKDPQLKLQMSLGNCCPASKTSPALVPNGHTMVSREQREGAAVNGVNKKVTR